METGGDTVFTADYIKKRRIRNGKTQYLVKWKGCPSRLNTWEPEDNILDPGLVLEFEERLAREYRSGRPGRRPRSLMTVKEMKNRRRTLLAKVKQHRYLAELVNNGNAKSLSDINEDSETKSLCSNLSESEEKTNIDVNQDKLETDDETDNNGNIPSLTSQNTVPTFPTKKPSHLSLDSNTNDLFLQPIPCGNYQNANSPLAGIVPSPTNVSSPKSATQPPQITDCPDIATPNVISPLSPNSTVCQGLTRLPTPTNTLKQGKFALLRKYRNSLEEKPKVSVTDVTVGNVTVAIHEGTSPKGFFRDRDGGNGSEVFW